ncbi:hypothetical protein XELAEV_18038319mg [Xenopus laevis]|uniref:1-acylglycerol-3-phosphate O-acyltransferase n=1 Tax=Xenopus laevis TaxID=8355 RepID=A0A974H6V4_XENLA|nr:hypothetical protein XELAEV_18038319mg [Xenopus laevis]
MDLGWLLWTSFLILVPFILMEISSSFKFHFKLVSYCVLCLLISALAAPMCLLRNGGRTVDNMRCSMWYSRGLMEILPDRCVQIAKKELMYAGSVGLLTYLGGVIYINRKRTSDAKSIMAAVAQAMISDNLKVWVYPEGTRNNTGDLLPFKKGAFHLALQSQVPIIPVVYSSFTSFYNQKKNLFTGGTIKVEILPKIDTSDFTEKDITDLTEKCHQTMRQVFFRLSNKPYKDNGQSNCAQ